MVSEKEFNPKTQVKEFKRTCNECGKVWHSLAGREKKINDDIKNNACSQCAFCGNPGAQLQAKRNVEAGESELERLKKCPDCSSGNYKEEVVIYEKK